MSVILRPCVQCAVRCRRAEDTQPAECLLRYRCPVCGDTGELALCPLCAVEVKAIDEAGRLHCSECHDHPRHECVPVVVDAEVPL